MKLTPIRLKRINSGVDFENAIESLGISKSMLYKIETGRRSPSKDIIFRMSKLYDCSIDEIFMALKINGKMDKEAS